MAGRIGYKIFSAMDDDPQELFIEQSLPIPTKSESRGGSGGEVVDIKEHPWRLHSLTISYQGLIDAFSFSYIDQYGEKQHVGPWGEQHSYHKTETIRFSPSEFVEEVSGAYGSHFENLLVTSLTFVTNVRTYGPFGNPNHQNVAAAPLKFMADEGSSIVAFHGRSGSHLFSIGVYMYPNNKRKGRTLLA
uniref:Jacalin-type lectin domain-containing protein n=1 Tax=Aegilops tauschii subsp. strangulata TaxID=200361 RepID=A0A453Q934_AEGTS